METSTSTTIQNMNVNDKHREMQEKFRAQQEARLQSRKESKAKGEAERDPKESVGLFWNDLRKSYEDVTRALDGLMLASSSSSSSSTDPLTSSSGSGSGSGSSSTNNNNEEALTRITTKIQGLEKRITDASALFLPPYDVRRAQEEAAGLREKLENVRTALAPRKKFSFASRRSKAAAAVGAATKEEERVGGNSVEKKEATQEGNTSTTSSSTSTPPPSQTHPPSSSTTTATATLKEKDDSHHAMEGFTSHSNTTLTLSSLGPIPPKDLLLRDLTNCTIHLLAPLHFLRMENLLNCKVLVGPVSGPVYLESCRDCTFHLASRQLRIHNTHTSTLYVHTVSGPIIEDCDKLMFAPFVLVYEGVEGDMKESGLAGTRNTWQDVKDFKWLRAQQSPHWSVVPEGERVVVERVEKLEGVGGGKEEEKEETEEGGGGGVEEEEEDEI